jgi:hypothetical protein
VIVCYLHYHVIVCVVFVQFIRTFVLDAQSENLLSNTNFRHRSSSITIRGRGLMTSHCCCKKNSYASGISFSQVIVVSRRTMFVQ